MIKLGMFLLLVSLSSVAAVNLQDREEFIRDGFEITFLPKFNLRTNPKIFLSYAWDPDARTEVVHRLGRDLKKISEKALLDIIDNPPGTMIVNFVSNISSSTYAFMFGSEAYRRKWNERERTKSALVTEAELIYEKSRRNPGSILGIHLQGASREDSFPEFMYPFVTEDCRGDDYYIIFKNILSFLWKKEQRSAGELEDNWRLFESYRHGIIDGSRDADVIRGVVDIKDRAQQRERELTTRITSYQIRLREEKDTRQQQLADDFLE